MKKWFFSSILALSLLLPSCTPVVSQQLIKSKIQNVSMVKDNMYDNHNAFVDESKYSLEKILESVEVLKHEVTYKIDYEDLEGKLKSITKKTRSLGSGVVIEKKEGKAYILTNDHVTQGNSTFNFKLPDSSKLVKTIKVSEKTYIVKNWFIFKTQVEAKKVASDIYLDVALLEVKDSKDFKKFPYKIGNSDDLRAGDFVWVIGNPLGIEDYTLKGNVSKKSYGNPHNFMIGCDVQPGHSGGAVVAIRDGEYELVGLVEATLARPTDDKAIDALAGYGFAIKINPIMNLVDNYFYFDSLKIVKEPN